jgi:hypothetical protein
MHAHKSVGMVVYRELQYTVKQTLGSLNNLKKGQIMDVILGQRKTATGKCLRLEGCPLTRVDDECLTKCCYRLHHRTPEHLQLLHTLSLTGASQHTDEQIPCTWNDCCSPLIS